jgi:hypothetical protein
MTSIWSFDRAHPKPQRPAPQKHAITPAFGPTLIAITWVVQGGLGIELMTKNCTPSKGDGKRRRT